MRLLVVACLLLFLFPAFGDNSLMDQKEINVADPYAELRSADWDSVSAIGLGNDYSIAFQTRKANPILAEYYQRVLVFGGDSRNSTFLGALQLRMNTGGRTHTMIYRHLDKKMKVTGVSFIDRYGIQFFTLPEVKWGAAGEKLQAKPEETIEYVGLVSGEALPDKFFSPAIYSEAEAKKSAGDYF